MSYYINKSVKEEFEVVIERVGELLKEEGFGVLTEIDVQTVLKNKIDVDFRKYRILGACIPHYAYRALQAEDKIGIMLPCNVIVQELSPGEIEVAAVDPIASMASVGNKALLEMATEVKDKLGRVIEQL
ncbi:MAG: DUF302 domain-containing protein [Reichenbachiella sp.]|uniref:DUF302 domain-containing protein n=1 Tax=Reichenbachiella sp. TaxID=2184521 RepID=UPI003262CE96